MAKERGVTARAPARAAPGELTMGLHEPGMTALHRAGLGGLVATLRHVERAWESGGLDEQDLPGAPWPPGEPPWEVGGHTLTLRFGPGEGAAEFFRRLFRVGFAVRDEVVFLPGQYGGLPPPLPVRAALQDGLLRTFYDHGPKARGLGAPREVGCEVDEAQFVVRCPEVRWYFHQREGARLAAASLTRPQALTRMLYPGATQRHVRHAGSSITNPAPLFVPLLFAPVGCFALRAGGRRVNEGGRRVYKPGGAVIVPDFDDLVEAPALLASLVPREVRQTRVVSLGDAALGAEIRLRSAGLLHAPGLAGVRAVWCCAADWNSRLQPPARVFQVDQRDLTDERLNRYAAAVAALPSRVLADEEGQGHWVDSASRPLIADNLALGRPWYEGFARLMTAADASGRPARNQIRYEQRGLHAMTADPTSLDGAEAVLVRAVHRAIRNNLGRIREETDGDRPLSRATRNRWDRFKERLRLSLVGAKTADQCRNALCTLFANAGVLPELQGGWQAVLPMLRERTWQLTRDLALLALASYARPEEESGPGPAPQAGGLSPPSGGGPP